MEREIKFRGKNSKGEWIYGDLIHNRGAVFIAPIGIANPLAKAVDFMVDEETVVEFTGLHDKNGKEVYINDIVRTKYGRLCIVKCFLSPCQVGIDLKPIEIEHQYPSQYDLYLSENLEVVGNIHDNPELIKK